MGAPFPTSIEAIYQAYLGRREGLIRALTDGESARHFWRRIRAGRRNASGGGAGVAGRGCAPRGKRPAGAH